MARLEGSWWIPNRGVFRASAGREIGGLRRHRAGEFSADWPWLLEMSLLGAFVRIPERLVTKFYLPGSLSRSWRFGARQWAAVAASAMTAVARRRLSLRDRMRLRATIARRVLKQFRRSARSRMNRAHEGEADPRGASAAARRPEPALVSVIVPVHDRFELAERAIRSVAAQTYRPLELIVVDDASRTPFLLRPSELDFDARLARLETNRGPGAARDAGRRLARGEYVAYLDSDDFWAPGHLASLTARLRTSPETGMAYASTMEMHEGRAPALRRWTEESCEEILPTLLWKRPWHTSACLWRRDLVDAMGGWMPTWHWEDHEHDARAGCLGAKLIHVPEPTCFAEVDSPGSAVRELRGPAAHRGLRPRDAVDRPSHPRDGLVR